MKRLFIGLGLLIAVLGLSSCQSIDHFVVVNGSNAVVEVVYTFVRTSSGYMNLVKPRWLEAANLTEADRTWEPIQSDLYLIDAQEGRVTVQLAPGKALLLNTASNYREDSAAADTSFGISSLALTGEKGSIKLEGGQARKLFRFEHNCHLFTYE